MRDVTDRTATGIIQKYNADLKRKPTGSIKHRAFEEVYFPDCHGNSILVLHHLLIHNFIEPLDQRDYDWLFTLYSTINQESRKNIFTKEEIERIIDIFSRCRIPQSSLDVNAYFIGDLIGDRGSNDLITILMLDTLRKRGLKIFHIAGNHEFIALKHITEHITRVNSDRDSILGEIDSEQNNSFFQSSKNCCTSLTALANTNRDLYLYCINAVKRTIYCLDFFIARNNTFISHAPLSISRVFRLARNHGISQGSYVERLSLLNTLIKQKVRKFIDSDFSDQTLREELVDFQPNKDEQQAQIYPLLYDLVDIRELIQADFEGSVCTIAPEILINIHGHLGVGKSAASSLTKIAEEEGVAVVRRVPSEGKSIRLVAINLDNTRLGRPGFDQCQGIYLDSIRLKRLEQDLVTEHKEEEEKASRRRSHPSQSTVQSQHGGPVRSNGRSFSRPDDAVREQMRNAAESSLNFFNRNDTPSSSTSSTTQRTPLQNPVKISGKR